MEQRFVDIHSHLCDPAFDGDRETVIARMGESGIRAIAVGTDTLSSQKVSALAMEHRAVFACIGIHPEDGKGETFTEEVFAPMLHSKVVAVGECGLDYYREPKDKVYEEERTTFEAQIAFAVQHDLPLMLHVRPSKKTIDAYEDTLAILSSWKKQHPSLRGNSHFFAGDTQIAKQLFDLDFTISFTGVITFTNDYDEVIQYAPLERIHAETDAPYVTPAPFRGERNEPLYVSRVIARIAQIKGLEEVEVQKALLENADTLFFNKKQS